MVLCTALATAVGAQTPLGLVDVTGSLGYTHRAITGSTSSDASSNLLTGSINARSYVWQPWFATVSAGLRVAQDSTRFSAEGSSTDSSIVTGHLDLNVLQQSRTPFTLSLRTTDSRIDTVSVPSSLTTLGGREFQTRRVSMRQSYFNNQGDRFQARYDWNTWDSGIGEDFLEQLFGLEMSLRRPRHTLQAKTTYQDTERQVLNRQPEVSVLTHQTDRVVMHVDHFYHPTRALRVDTMANYFDSDTSAEQPQHSTNHGDSNLEQAQVSSFVFWRPVDRPFSVSAGVRAYDLSASTVGNDLTHQSITAMSGMFYQITKNLRLDANVDATVIGNDDERNTTSRQRAGYLYQSDIHEIYARFRYNWHTSGAVQHQDLGDVNILSTVLRLGHDAQRFWLTDGRGTYRASLSQTVSATQQGGDVDLTTQRIDHSGSLAWDMHDESGSSTLQLTLADSRGFGDQADSQQLVNAQAHRNQALTLRSELSGNLTLQVVRRDFNGLGYNDTVTASGLASYRHRGVFNIAQLRYQSNLRILYAGVDQAADRAEWENRLDYAIGKLDTSFSWRYLNFDNVESYSIVYFQVNRHF